MTELLAFVLVAHVILTPLVLVGVAIRQRKRIGRLEREIQRLATPARAGAPAPATPVHEAPLAPPVIETQATAPVPEGAQESGPRPVPVFAAADAAETAPREPGRAVARLTAAREFLRGIGLWPPAGAAGHDREALLMQWWLPRAGGLLALLSALFFGVYINQGTSPLFKCAELVAVSLAIAALGRRMERRTPAFGGVLIVTGLIMLYLTSVAAYVLPATRVIESPLAGALAQASVLLIITVVGFLRRSQGIVLLAFHFGFLLGVFMAWEGMREGALIAAGLLFIAGALLARLDVFRRLVWVVVPGAFLVAMAFPALALLRTVEVPGAVPVQVFLNLALAGTALLHLAGGLGTGRRGRLLLSLGSSLAIVATGWFFRAFDPAQLEWAALVLGCNMLGWSLAAWALRGCGFLVQLLFIKAAFLVGVWAVLHHAGDTRWMILALQTVVVALAARRSRAAALEAATWAVALASLVLRIAPAAAVPAAGSFVWWMMALYPAVPLLALALVLPVMDRPGFKFLTLSRKHAYALLPAAAALLWYQLFNATPQRGFELAEPFVVILYAAGLLSLVPFLARWMLAMLAALAFLAASMLFCSAPFGLVTLLAIIGAAAIALAWLARQDGRWPAVGENAVYVLALAPLTLWALQAVNDWPGQALMVNAMAAGVLLLGMLPRLRHAGAWAFLPPLVLLLSEAPATFAGPWMIAAVAGGLAWLALPLAGGRIHAGMGWARRQSAWAHVGAVILWWQVVVAGNADPGWMTWQAVLCGAALLLLAAAWRFPVPGYFTGALLFAGTAFARHFSAMLGEAGSYAPWISEALASAGLLYAITLLGFFLRPRPWADASPFQARQADAILAAVWAVLFFLTSVLTFRYEPLGWGPWYTPLLAISAFILILLGLFRADPVFRRLGLASLAFPLVRLFLVDIQDALHRIIAFAAAAALLALLGYLYHRLAARLGQRADQDLGNRGDARTD